jgi:hypothetical protein
MSYNTFARLLQGGTLGMGGTFANFAHGAEGIPAGGSVTIYTGLGTVLSVIASPSGVGSFGAVQGSALPGGSIQLFGRSGSVFGIGPGSAHWIALGI